MIACNAQATGKGLDGEHHIAWTAWQSEQCESEQPA